MALQLLPTDTHEQQLAKYVHAIDNLTRRCTFDGVEISYLPRSAVDTLTSRQDITVFITKSTYPREEVSSVHDAIALIDLIEWKSKKLFLLAIKLGLSLEFLSTLLDEMDDDDLPIAQEKHYKISENFRISMFKFLRNQALVCAPVLGTEKFDQVVPYLSCIPFSAVHVVRERSVYDVSFDLEHLRQGDEKVWRMEVFGSAEEADVQRPRFQWGFICEGRWYFFREKPNGDVDEDYEDDREGGEGDTPEVMDVPDAKNLPGYVSHWQ